MIIPKLVDEVFSRLSAVLPAQAGSLQSDLERNLRAALAAGLERLNLVTRAEFDAQAGVLLRTQEKVRQLEQQVARLEQTVLERPAPPDRP
jgi:hypothetical protein